MFLEKFLGKKPSAGDSSEVPEKEYAGIMPPPPEKDNENHGDQKVDSDKMFGVPVEQKIKNNDNAEDGEIETVLHELQNEGNAEKFTKPEPDNDEAPTEL